MAFKEQFSGKKVLITGAGRGLGRALVKRLYEYGAKVYALSRTAQTLMTLKQECPGVETICVDLADWDETRKALEQIEPVDCLVNNAGLIVVKPLMTTSPEEFDMILNTNLKAVLNICQVVAQKMISAGKAGSIVNVSSVTGNKPARFCSMYGTSKAALQMFSKCLAVELAGSGIRVNVFQPAGLDTDMMQQLSTGVDQLLDKKIFIDQLSHLTPTNVSLMPIEECLNTLMFLMSDLTTQIVGASIAIDGGFLCT